MVFKAMLILLAFAANSLLGRWAMGEWQADPLWFATVRLTAGGIMLALLCRFFSAIRPAFGLSSPAGGLTLLVYAVAFAFSYQSVDTGVGAFILFATVQVALLLVAYFHNERLTRIQWLGVVLSVTGLALLLLPGKAVPSFLPALLMVISGLGWAGFVIAGRQSSQPLMEVQQAFALASLIVTGVFFSRWLLTGDGHLPEHWQPWSLAIISGAVASGLGYWGWYQILPSLGLQRAAQLQLLVPLLAVAAGTIVLGEAISGLMMLAAVLITGGVYLALKFRA